MFHDRFSQQSLGDKVLHEVQAIISDNEANPEDTEIILSHEKWRLEVKSTATFESISDYKLIQLFQPKVPQKGYGPQLIYLENIY